MENNPDCHPEMIGHYVGQAIALAGSTDEVSELDQARKDLLSELEKTDEDNSDYSRLKKKCLSLLTTPWKTRQDFIKFKRDYNLAHKEIFGYSFG